MIRLTIDGSSESFRSDMTASAAVVRLGHDPREVGLRRTDGTFVGATRTLGDVLNDRAELELVRL
jgi:hypothetical protein